MRVDLTVNGAAVIADVEPRLLLVDFLREHCLLTGTHIGCEQGVCGACTVLLDGAPARSCIAYAAACEGADVRTIEGLEDDPVTQRLRAAFTAEHALQCGYCTPGMLVTARDIALRLPGADTARIRLELAGNLCRCTGYVGIVRAIDRVLRKDPLPQVAAPEPLPLLAPLPPAVAAPAAPQQAGPSLSLDVTVDCPRALLWSALHDPALLSGCVPGARLTGISGDRIDGEVEVALGPISAVFSGSGSLALDAALWRATLSGEGRDRRSSTRLSGSATITLEEAGAAATRVMVVLSYALRGPLAQFARGPVVEALAAEIANTVVRNLAQRLAGDAPARAPTRLSAGRLLLRLIRQWLRLG
jgi:aerobic carbon-monoxide dehydrogenase small subunit